MAGFLGGIAGGTTVSILIRAVDNYSKEFKQLDKGIKKQESSFKKLGKFLHSTGLGYIAVATAVVSFAKISVSAALKSEQAMQQFNLKMGDVADTMLGDMRKASKGMISDFELVKNANSALALGISKNQIPALLEVATARSKVFGRTASEAFNDLAIGIGRQSRLILDNLGIILNLDDAYADYAKEIGSTVEKLTDLEKKEALVNAILRESEGLVQANIFLQETHTEKIERLTATYENAKSKIGEFLLELYDEAVGINDAEEALKEHIDSVIGIVGAYDEAAEASLALSDAERDLAADLQTSNDAAADLIDQLLNLKDITFEGERGSNLEIAKQKEVIRQLELKELQKGDEVSKLDEERKKLEILSLEDNVRGDVVSQIDTERKALQILNLEADKFNKTIPDQSEIVRKLEIRELKGEDVSEQLSKEGDKLKLLQLQNNEFSYSIANRQETIRQLELEAIKRGNVVTEIDKQGKIVKQLELEAIMRGDVISQLDKEKEKLNVLRLENDKFSNEREIQQAQNEINLETIGELEATNVEKFISGQNDKIGKIVEERYKQDDIRDSIEQVQDANSNLLSAFDSGQVLKQEAYDLEKESIDELIKKTNELASAYKNANQANTGVEEKPSIGSRVVKNSVLYQAYEGIKSVFDVGRRVFGKETSVGDAILRPNGEVIKTSPKDTLIATQSPGQLGEGGLTLIIQGDIYGTDPDNMADAFADKMNKVIRLN